MATWLHPDCHLKQLNCRQWSCAECAPRLLASLLQDVMAGCPDLFITLTSRHTGSELHDKQAATGQAAIHKFMQRVGRHKKLKQVPYFSIVERHQNGAPHWHIALRCGYIHRSLVSKWWRELTGSYIVKVKRIYNVKGAAKYLGKYITKAPHAFKGRRRFARSRNWFVVDRAKPSRVGKAKRIIIPNTSLDELCLRFGIEDWEWLPDRTGCVHLRAKRKGLVPPLWNDLHDYPARAPPAARSQPSQQALIAA